MRKEVYTKAHVVLIAIVLLALVVQLVLVWTVPSSKEVRVANPDTLEAAVVFDARCAECVNASRVLDSLVEFGVAFDKVSVVKRDDADEMITEFGLERFPAIIVRGSSEMLEEFGVFERVGSSYVWKDLGAPYADLEGNVRGVVDVLAIADASCVECSNPQGLVDQLAQNGMVFNKQEVIDAADAAGVIARYGIEKVPTLVLSGEALEYAWLNASWPLIGSVESDGMLVLRAVQPPFVETVSGKVRGLIALTLLENASCVECMTAAEIARVFEENFGLVYASRKSIDVSSAQGRALQSKYAISAVPTIVMDAEASWYPAINATWSEMGSRESDGSFVLRSLAFS